MTRRSEEKEPFTCDGRCIRETDKAILVKLETGEEKWIPKSVVHDDSEVYEKGGEGKLVVQGWWAEAQGLS